MGMVRIFCFRFVLAYYFDMVRVLCIVYFRGTYVDRNDKLGATF